MEQCAPHAAATALVRESFDLHDDRESFSAAAQVVGCPRLLHACSDGVDVSSGGADMDDSSWAPLWARRGPLSAKPSRCVPKCGQRDGSQTAVVHGELPVPHRLKAFFPGC